MKRQQIEYVETARLVPMPGNPRRNEAAVPKVVESLKRFGWTSPILARREDRVVVAGHTRLEAAKALGMDKVPVVWLDLDPVSSRLYNLADNKLAEVADWDDAALAEMLAELSAEDAEGLAIAGFGDEAIARVLNEASFQAETDPDELPLEPVEVHVKQGDLWQLGPHRLLCGDCRSLTDVERLAAGARVNVCVTSPPYASQRAYDESSGFEPIRPDAYVEWFRDVSANVLSVLAEDGSYFVNIKEHVEETQRSLYVKRLVLAHAELWAWRFVEEYCWVHSGTPKKVDTYFKNGWEPVFHFSKQRQFKFRPEAVMHETDQEVIPGSLYGGANMSRRQGDRDVKRADIIRDAGRRGGDVAMAYPSNVLSVGMNREAFGHGAAFPVALPEFFIKAFSDPGDTVFDPFMGSGTTLIAAHKNGRAALGMELSPRYCQIIINRWEQFSGEKAVTR